MVKKLRVDLFKGLVNSAGQRISAATLPSGEYKLVLSFSKATIVSNIETTETTTGLLGKGKDLIESNFTYIRPIVVSGTVENCNGGGIHHLTDLTGNAISNSVALNSNCSYITEYDSSKDALGLITETGIPPQDTSVGKNEIAQKINTGVLRLNENTKFISFNFAEIEVVSEAITNEGKIKRARFAIVNNENISERCNSNKRKEGKCLITEIGIPAIIQNLTEESTATANNEISFSSQSPCERIKIGLDFGLQGGKPAMFVGQDLGRIAERSKGQQGLFLPCISQGLKSFIQSNCDSGLALNISDSNCKKP